MWPHHTTPPARYSPCRCGPQWVPPSRTMLFRKPIWIMSLRNLSVAKAPLSHPCSALFQAPGRSPQNTHDKCQVVGTESTRETWQFKKGTCLWHKYEIRAGLCNLYFIQVELCENSPTYYETPFRWNATIDRTFAHQGENLPVWKKFSHVIQVSLTRDHPQRVSVLQRHFRVLHVVPQTYWGCCTTLLLTGYYRRSI